MNKHMHKTTVGKRATKLIILVLYPTDQPHKCTYQIRTSRHHKESTAQTTANHIAEHSKWADARHEQYSRDAALEDEIADQLEQLYGQQ